MRLTFSSVRPCGARRVRLALLCAVGLLPAAAGATRADNERAYWVEGERYFRQVGSVRADLPPFASRGECLGSNWGGEKGHFVEYRFLVVHPLERTAAVFRYARLFEPTARFELTLDGRRIGVVEFPSTGGWGHRGDSEWQYVRISLGKLSAGWRTLRLTSLADRNNTNLDGFFLAPASFDPPNKRSQIERAPGLELKRGDRGACVDKNLSIESFAPAAEDEYYPPEEVRQRQELKAPRLVRWQGDRAVLRADGQPQEKTVVPGEETWGWHVVARLSQPRALVVERRYRRWGVFLYLDTSGTLAEIRKSVGEIAGVVHPRQKYPPGYMSWICDSRPDVLGQRVLAEGEPSFPTVAGWLPEVTGYTFLGVRAAKRKVAVLPDGTLGHLSGRYGTRRIEHPLFDPRSRFPGIHPTHAKRGLLGRFLPAIDYGFFDDVGGEGWEQIAFATAAGTFVGIRRDDRWQAFRLDPVAEVSPATLFQELFSLHRQWQRFAASATRLTLPEHRLVDASLAGLIRTRITYAGPRPKYGVGHYAGDQHDAFPPTTLWTVEAELEWGLFEEARADLDYYLDNLVRPDGAFDYYGPAVSEYGMMLERMARFARYTKDSAWVRRRREVAGRICEHLLRLRRTSLARKDVAPATRGLLFGAPEADTRKEVAYYYSGSMWAWRGLLEWGRLLCETKTDETRGEELLREAAALREDIAQSLAETASRYPAAPGFLPPYPGLKAPFATMTQDRLAAYTNYRYWLEMLSSGCLSRDQATGLVEYRRRHGGECLGMTRFLTHLDDWPYANYAWTLLALDQVDHFLLGYYGHLTAHQTRGAFSDFEQVDIRDVATRTYRADYCVPAQLTIPLLTRWMLVFEERDADRLWLCKAAPRRWFAPGQRWGVTDAPTRWGNVSFQVETGPRRITIAVTPPPRGAEDMLVRIRLPGGKAPSRVTVDGQPHEFDRGRSAVALRRPQKPCEVVVTR